MVPVRVDEAVRSHRYLSLIERQRIATLKAQGLSMREIARRLDRSPSTISRELRRNRARQDRGTYDAVLAHAARSGVHQSGVRRAGPADGRGVNA